MSLTSSGMMQQIATGSPIFAKQDHDKLVFTTIVLYSWTLLFKNYNDN